MLPLVILQGPAKSGKDTVANFMVKDGGFVAVAQADPMKQLAKLVFGFSDEQLWGESRDLKERIDDRYKTLEAWGRAELRLNSGAVSDWLKKVLPEYPPENSGGALYTWFLNLRDTNPNGVSPRVMLQTLGTQWGRSFSLNMWSDLAIRTAKDLLMTPNLGYSRDCGTFLGKVPVPTPAGVVITDGRFRNEIINVKATGGIAIRIDNPEQAEPSSVGIVGHASETEMFSIPAHFFDLIVTNDKTQGLTALREKVQTLIAQFKYVTVVP